jgi:ABC-type glutathione transport system ATPase component
MGTLVNAENIRGVYYTEGKDVVAVDNVSIKIEEGEVLGLAGESGSGKTTLGSIISLIARPPLHVEARWRSTARCKSWVAMPRFRVPGAGPWFRCCRRAR